MDALKFIEERNRMCDYYYRGDNALSGCAKCPGFQKTCVSVRSMTAEYIAAVEQWSREHPRKTRQDVFLEQWPEAYIDEDGILLICPKFISADYRNRYDNCEGMVCTDCRMEFWGQEAE